MVFCLPPFFHMYGAFILTLVLAGGGTLVMMPRFDLASFLAAVERHRVTRAYLVPPVVLALVNDPIVDAYDLSTLTCIIPPRLRSARISAAAARSVSAAR